MEPKTCLYCHAREKLVVRLYHNERCLRCGWMVPQENQPPVETPLPPSFLQKVKTFFFDRK